ncbi:MAG TPA: hypothetical protein DCP28_19650, partial [Cytophagales bacterium]|nr:hypothetical protein [Cytophagales bacterium]
MLTLRYTFPRLLTTLAIVVGCMALPLSGRGQNIARPNIDGPAGMQVNSFTGNLFLPRTDFYVAGTGLPLDASFAYNSARDTLNVGFGLGWTFQYHISYANRGSAVDILHADGRVDTYALQNGNYIPPIGVFDRLEQPQTGQFRLTTVDGET